MKRIRIDKLGRIVIPMHYRKSLGITTETDLDIECSNNGIIISLSKQTCKMCEKKLNQAFMDMPICDECVEKIRKGKR